MEMLTPKCKYPFLVFDNLIPQEDLNNVFDEVNYLKKFTNPPAETSSAINEYGDYLKSNTGIFLQDFYNTNFYDNNSFIVKSLKQMFNSDVQKEIRNYNPIFSHYLVQNLGCSILLSYYSDGDFYSKHYDRAIYTGVLWIHKEPKTFEGGEFLFHFEDDSVEEVEVKNNRMVLFPSFYKHEVKRIKSLEEYPRCAVSMFLNINS